MLHAGSKGVAMNKLICWVAVAVAGLGGAAVQAGTVLHVDDDAPLGGDGLSWDTAYRFLQDALADAAGVTEIRVAQGTYKPDQDEAGNVTSGDRQATFQLINGVALMGGFAGLGAPTPDDRDITGFETILSGDLLGDDGPNFANNGENSFHVTRGGGTGDTAVLDGFTITGGNANGPFPDFARGGGMWNNGGSPTVTNCTFRGNSGDYGSGMGNRNNSSPTVTNCTFSGNSTALVGGGGGMLNDNSSSPTVTNCAFSGNAAGIWGGGMYNCDSSPTVTNCTFSGNSAESFNGGGMYNFQSSPTVTNCKFSGNTADFGGGMLNDNSSSPMVTNSTFSGNAAGIDGGGMFNFLSDTTVTNCTFSGNTAGGSGGGMWNHGGSPTVTNCVLWNDIPNEITEVFGEVTTVRYSNVQGGWPGVGNIDADPLFVIPPNVDFRLSSGSPSIDAGHNWAIAAITDTDLNGNPRFADDPATADTGCGVPVVVDMGAYEFQGNPATVKVGDIDGDGAVAVPDLLTLLAAWGPTGGVCQLADFDLDDIVGVPDLLTLLANWG